MKITIANCEVDIDLSALRLTQEKLSDHLVNEAAIIGYYGVKHAEAAAIVTELEDKIDYVIGKKYIDVKKTGEANTDKMAEYLAKNDEEVFNLRMELIQAKKNKDILWAYLKSLDKNHENALNMAYNSRRELSALKYNSVSHEMKNDAN